MYSSSKSKTAGGFTLVEMMVAVALVSIGFLGAYAMVLRGGSLVAAAEEEGLVCSGLEQRLDQLRELAWPALTDGTGLTGTVLTSRPASLSGLRLSDETITITGYGSTTKTLTGTWGTGAATTTFGSGTADLSTASAVKVVATVTWAGRRSSKTQSRSLVTIISKGGISKSEL